MPTVERIMQPLARLPGYELSCQPAAPSVFDATLIGTLEPGTFENRSTSSPAAVQLLSPSMDSSRHPCRFVTRAVPLATALVAALPHLAFVSGCLGRACCAAKLKLCPSRVAPPGAVGRPALPVDRTAAPAREGLGGICATERDESNLGSPSGADPELDFKELIPGNRTCCQPLFDFRRLERELRSRSRPIPYPPSAKIVTA